MLQECPNCHHYGVHAEVIPPEGGWPTRCTHCQACDAARVQEDETTE